MAPGGGVSGKGWAGPHTGVGVLEVSWMRVGGAVDDVIIWVKAASCEQRILLAQISLS